MRKLLSGFLVVIMAAALFVTPVSADEFFTLYAPGPNMGARPLQDEGKPTEWLFYGDGDMYNFDGSEFLVQSYTDGGPWCPDVTKVTFKPDKSAITSLGINAFKNCPNLNTIELPPTVQRIGRDGFYGCSGLQTITLSRDLTTLGERTFAGCSSLENVTIPDGVTSIEKEVFSGCTSLQTVTLPANLTSIGEGAFSGCTSLDNVVIPNTVTSIAKNAFSGCTNLKTITISSGLQSIGENAFFNCTGLENVAISDGVTSIAKNAFSCCTSLQSVTLPTNLSDIAEGAFSGCTSLAGVDIPDSVTAIGKDAFSGCTSLEKVAISDNTADISAGAFSDCSSIKSLKLPSGLTNLGSGVFSGCTGLTTLKLPAGLVSLSYDSETDNAFSGSSLSKVYFAGTKEEWANVQNSEYFPMVQCQSIATNKGTATRLAGANRVGTSLLAADALKETLGVEQFDAVVLADSSNFPDALTGSSLATEKHAPIILVNSVNYAESVDYVKDNLEENGTVYVLGGTGAVPEAVVCALDGVNGFTVTRLSGANRYLTNLSILDTVDKWEGVLLITSGDSYADSLSASALGFPMMIVRTSLTAEQKEWLSNNPFEEYIIIGGTGVVSKNVENALGKDYAKSPEDVHRLAGANRYETSLAIANNFFEGESGAVLAYAVNFPDGLCGGPLAYATNSPLLLTTSYHVEEPASFTAGADSLHMYVLGGETLITDSDVERIGE